MKQSGIYKIINIVNGLFYIGSSENFVKRFKSHKSLLKLKKHPNIYLQRAWDKYGKEAFQFQIIEEVTDVTKLIEREQHYLDTLQCFADLQKGYNICKTAGSTLGYFPSEETRKKMGNSHKGKKNCWYNKPLHPNFIASMHRPKSLTTKKKLSKIKTGQKLSETTKEKISKSSMGRVFSDETKQKIRISNSKNPRNGAGQFVKRSVDDKGVGITKRGERFAVRISTWKSDIYVGMFDTFEEAFIARTNKLNEILKEQEQEHEK